jgi:hypothetical protein
MSTVRDPPTSCTLPTCGLRDLFGHFVEAESTVSASAKREAIIVGT